MSGTATDTCYDPHTDMLSVEEAVDALLAQAQPLADTGQLDLAHAGGRVLAQDVASPIDVPGFDNSAMDGYALHSRDLAQAQGDGMAITQRITAGSTGDPLEPGCAARIFTGAPVPAGADTVVMQEHCRVENKRLFLEQPVAAGANIRPRGNDIAAGSTILQAGTVLQAAELGLAASVGIAAVSVYRRLKVAVFSTGDELVEPGQALAPGQIYNSNRYQLIALLQSAGCAVIDLGTIADDYELTRQTLLDAAQQADLVITSGGVSVGEEDHIKSALDSVGELNLWRVRMKPGKPLAFGRIGDVPFIGLPGNPVSVYVTFLLFARPFLQRRQGRERLTTAAFLVSSGFACQGRQRREYIRARLHSGPQGEVVAERYAKQGSDVLSSVAWADGLVEIPESEAIAEGDTVRFLPFPGWTL